MDKLLSAICSVAVFSVFSAVIIALLPRSAKHKSALAVLCGLISVLLFLPILNIKLSDFDFSSDGQLTKSNIDNYLNQRVTAVIKPDIEQKSKPLLKKYGIESADIELGADILPESGIFIKRVNYIISEGLSSGVEDMRKDLCSATGYNCYVIVWRSNE